MKIKKDYFTKQSYHQKVSFLLSVEELFFLFLTTLFELKREKLNYKNKNKKK